MSVEIFREKTMQKLSVKYQEQHYQYLQEHLDEYVEQVTVNMNRTGIVVQVSHITGDY